jgi:hypothetical protein
MPFKLTFLLCIVLCVIALFDVLLSMRKNSLLKICVLLIIASLFVMNYFSYLDNVNRLQVALIKCARVVYACGTILIVIQHVTPKIPKWIIGIITLSVVFLIGLRIFYFDRLAVDSNSPFASQIFTVGPELSSPIPLARNLVYGVVVFFTLLTFYFYRKFFMVIKLDDDNYKVTRRWIISLVIPFFLLVVFGILGSLRLYEQSLSAFLFSLFSFIAIFAILFRPRLLNITGLHPMTVESPVPFQQTFRRNNK